MHKFAEKIAECLKAKVEAKGIDNIEGQDLVELGMWADIIKDLVCYDKDKKIIEAMDEAEESEEAMKYIEMYEDYPERKGYRGQPRSQSGRFISRGDGRRSNRGRRGYESPMMYDDDWEEMERNRDFDRKDGKMYYGGSGSSSSNMSGGNRGYSESGESRDMREGRSGQSRRGYMEAKEQGKDKMEKMKNLEEYMKELSTDVTEMITDMSPEEKTLMKQKMSTLMQKIQ